MRNLAQRVSSEYFSREEFRISALPSLAGSEASGSVEITFIVLPRTLRNGGKVRQKLFWFQHLISNLIVVNISLSNR